MSKADIAMIGLAVMGENLALNMLNHGFSVAVYNRNTEAVDKFVNGRAKGKEVIGCHSYKELCENLKTPRKVMMMVKAGPVVDDVIKNVLPFLEKGDIIIDGGNSHYPDSNRRVEELAAKGIHFIGAGISGGEEGALNGPSIMPGGASAAWPAVKPIFQSICAKTDDGSPCCDWVGDAGSGHFVKMVHNGIEYGDMQLICEAFQLLHECAGLSYDDLANAFAEWNKGALDSYLIEITADIFRKKDDETGKPMLDVILDTAGQKGTGKWTATVALDLGMPLTLIGEAVFARCLSALKEQRVEASKIIRGPKPEKIGNVQEFVQNVRDALYCAKIVSYAQGFTLMREAAKEFKWNLNYGSVALMWRGGCIIRSKFLGKIGEAFSKNPDLANLLLDPFFKETVEAGQAGWRKVTSVAALNGIPNPAISCALSYFDGYRSDRLPANLLQAQRDYFGAHTYERVDRPRGQFFHTNWTGRGGTTSSTSYSA
ncbi:MAG: decarboxylating NADP(+)-dependent phosphogluconate dehydrogenase [Bdellovibrionota bacterium]